MPSKPSYYTNLESLCEVAGQLANFLPYVPAETEKVKSIKARAERLKRKLDRCLKKEPDELKRYAWEVYSRCIQNYSAWLAQEHRNRNPNQNGFIIDENDE
jgi:hypothetical protein